MQCGFRGCCALTKRRGVLRYCAQKAVVEHYNGKTYCFYHDPHNPRHFGGTPNPDFLRTQRKLQEELEKREEPA